MQAKRPTGKSRFQSTLPAGEATVFPVIDLAGPRAISIHASRGGSDSLLDGNMETTKNFNPRFPRGKRQRQALMACSNSTYFNPRFPRGKRRNDRIQRFRPVKFQSTLPAGEATLSLAIFGLSSRFQSTLPAGEATLSKT